MNKKNKIILIFCILFFIPYKSSGIEIFKEVVFLNTTSFHVLQQNDSILKKKYNKILNDFNQENYSVVLSNSLELISLAKKYDVKEILILTNYIVGETFEKTQNFDKAIIFYRRAYRLLVTSNLKTEPIDGLNVDNDNLTRELLLKLGSTYQKLHVTENKKIYKDSALYFYNEIKIPLQLNIKASTIKAKAYSNLAGIYLNDSLYDVALDYTEKSIDIHRELNNNLSLSFALSNQASVLLLQGKYDEAIKEYNEAIDVIKFDKSIRATKLKEDLYFNYAYTLYKLKDYKAYEYLESSYEIKDNIREKGFRKAVEEIYAINNVEKVKKEEALKRAEANKKMWLIVLSSAILIIALAFIAGFYRLRQKNLRLKLSQNELLQEQKIEKLRSLSQKRILNATLDGKETERKEIAETLHDSVSALLSSANLHLQATRNQFNGATPIEIEKSQNIITEASQKIRSLSHNLVSSVLLKFGIKYAVNDLINKFSNSQINFEAQIGDVSRFNQDFEIKIHNIIQELVNNILKHSKATIASITIDQYDGNLFILISDNGKGFNPKKIQEKDGLGLNQIEARIHMMNGKFSINSQTKKGTDIEIEVPIALVKITDLV